MLEILLAVLCFILTYLFIIKYFRSNDDFWPSRKIPFLTLRDITTFSKFYLTKETSTLELDTAYYNLLKQRGERFGGVMELRTPCLIVADLELVKQIMVKDFDYFVNRRDVGLHTKDPFYLKMLLNLNNQEWKDSRAALSPTFSTGKIRRMFPNFDKCGNHLVDFIKKFIRNSEALENQGGTLEMHEASTRFILDVIVNTAFGIETKCLQDQDSVFYKMARKSQEPTAYVLFTSWLVVNFPKVARFFNITFMQRDAVNYFSGVLKMVHEQRKKSGESRDDFLQLMMEVKESGTCNVDFSDDFITAQSVSFFFAAFEAPGSLLSFCGYMLAMHPDMQERLRKEVDKAFQIDGDGTDFLTYDAVVYNMPYMEMFVSEVLRQFPPGARTERVCTRDYPLPGCDAVLPKGTIVSIPIFALQNDDRYFSHPEKFDPERYAPENKSNIHPYSLLAFGHGPRNCIGTRIAMVETKVAVAYLVRNFKLTPAEGVPSTKLGMLRRDRLYLKFTSR